jgi:hypothetical protein
MVSPGSGEGHVMNIRSAILVVSTSAAALAVTLVAAGPSAAGGHTSPSSPGAEVTEHLAPAHIAGKGICFSNLVDDSQVGIVSQDFGPGQTPSDAQGADDFALPRRCRVSTVGIDGLVFNGVATTFNITFYKDRGGRPGRVLSTETSTTFGPCPPRVACNTAITLPSAVRLKRGTGWVSVQDVQDWSEGQFVWVTGLTQSGHPAVWENPGDGWGTGCTTWTKMQSCWGDLNPGPDFEFVLLK